MEEFAVIHKPFWYFFNKEIRYSKKLAETGIVNFSLADPNATILNETSITVTRKKSILEKWYITIPVGFVGGFLLAN